jgi:hypothetical protein
MADVLSVLLALSVAGTQSQTTNAPSAIAGTWTGDSVCLVKPSACTDEASVYRISIADPTKATVALEANKVVKGKEVRMGVSECAYDLLKHHVTCTLANENMLTFDLAGDHLTGAMTLKDGTRWRTITLRRAPPGSSVLDPRRMV